MLQYWCVEEVTLADAEFREVKKIVLLGLFVGDWWIKWAVGFGGSLGVSLALHRFLPRASAVLFGGR